MTVVFHVDGIPKAQPRPRAFAMRFGDKVRARMYDAGTAENWKSCIALAARPHQPASPLTGPISLQVTLALPRPKSRCRKSDDPGPIWCTTKPDAENLAKPIMDCLTQIGWWRDDSQVALLLVTKRYHAIGGRPGACIVIEELTPAKEPASSPETGGHGPCGLARRAPGNHAEDLGAPATPSRRRLGASQENAR